MCIKKSLGMLLKDFLCRLGNMVYSAASVSS